MIPLSHRERKGNGGKTPAFFFFPLYNFPLRRYNKIKEALMKATCADLHQKFFLTRKKNAGILTDFKFF